jgi:aminoglycoside phosphotransferase (APT) family kinase protein
MSLSEPFFAESRHAMHAQTSTISRPLTDRELDQLQKNIKSALLAFIDTGIPDTLLHGDIGHGNIIASSNGPVFLDWAETYIGHPFVTAEHLLADLARSNPLFSENQSVLRLVYADLWKTYVSPAELEKIVALAPAIAAFAYALICWDANRNRPDLTLAWPLLRSMLRTTGQKLDLAMEAVV